jgi:hypothetical protein
MKKLLVGLCLIAGSIGTAQAQTTPEKYPLHFVNYWWKGCSDNKPLTNISVPFKVNGDFDNVSGIYIAPVGLAEVNGIKFYGGIQTNTGGWKSKEERKIVKVGKGGIFSRWAVDNNPLSLDYAGGDTNTLYESAMYEGSFVSVRKKFEWQSGEHVYVYSLDVTADNDGKSSWLVASVENLSTNERYEIGKLKFEGKELRLGKDFASFVEIYSGDKKSFPSMKVSFMTPFINGVQCKSQKVQANYPNDNKYAQSTTSGGWVTATIKPKWD